MALPERREVAELITRLQFEPGDVDVFVEGPTDCVLIDWYLRQHDRRGYKVFPIEDIHLPDSDLPRGSPQSGNRDRVIGLSDLLAAHFEARPAPVVCLADQDLDVVLGPAPANDFLIFTDGTSLESLFFHAEVLDRFLSLFIRRRIMEPTQLIDALAPVLEEVFFVRAADRTLQLGAGSLPPSRCCAAGAPGLLEFDRDDYLQRYLGRVAAISRLDEVRQEIQRLRQTSSEGRVRLMHGDDFLDLLCWTLRPFVRDRRLVQPPVAHRALMASLEVSHLDTLTMFQSLLCRVPA